MLCVRTCISSEDVRAAVVGKSRIMAEHIRKLSSVQGKGLFRNVLEFCLGLAKKLGFVTRESDDGSYGVCETGEGEKTYIINIHLGKRKAEDERESSVVNDYAGPAVCILYSLSICRELSGRIPFRIQVCFLPEDDGFLDCCIPAAGKLSSLFLRMRAKPGATVFSIRILNSKRFRSLKKPLIIPSRWESASSPLQRAILSGSIPSVERTENGLNPGALPMQQFS